MAHAARANWRTTTAATASSGWSHSWNQGDCIFGETAKQGPVRDEASRTQNYSYIQIPTCRTCYIKMLKFYQKRGTRFLLPRGPNRHCHRFCWASHSELCVLDRKNPFTLHTLSSWKSQQDPTTPTWKSQHQQTCTYMHIQCHQQSTSQQASHCIN